MKPPLLWRRTLAGSIAACATSDTFARPPCLNSRRPVGWRPQLAKLDAWIDAHVAAEAALAAKAEGLQGVCGVGRVSALTVLALMPELGRITDNQAAALAGVAPLISHVMRLMLRRLVAVLYDRKPFVRITSLQPQPAQK